jgi:hypothetical protein
MQGQRDRQSQAQGGQAGGGGISSLDSLRHGRRFYSSDRNQDQSRFHHFGRGLVWIYGLPIEQQESKPEIGGH